MAAAIPAADALSKSAKQSKDGGVKQAVKAKIESASNGDLAGVNNRSCRPNLGNSPSSDSAIGRHNCNTWSNGRSTNNNNNGRSAGALFLNG